MPAVLRLFGYLRPYWRQVLLAVGAMIGTTGFSLIVPWLTGQAIDVGIAAAQPGLLPVFAGAVVASTLLRGLSAFGQTYFGEWLAQRVAYDLRNAIYDHVQNLSFRFHDRAQTGELMSRATADVEAVRWFFAFAVTGLAQIVLLVAGIVVILFHVAPKLALVTLAFVPLAVLAAARVGSVLRPSWARIQEQMGTMTTYLQESLAGIRIVRAFGREPERVAGFRAENETLHHLQVRQARLQAFNMPLMTLILSLATAVSLWVGGQDVLAGTLSVGELAAYLGYLTLLALPVRRLGFLINTVARAHAAGQRIFDLLDTTSEVQDRPGAIELPPVVGHVRFEHVSFGYDERTTVLKDITIEARPGEVVALLGATGSGKSTITLLLPRFYDVTAGRITIDGYDIRDVTIHSLRRQIGIVLQEPFLFSATIRDNIAYGREDAPFEKIVEAAKLAGAHDFIMSFPHGYDTWVGERGVTLSGGQKQRIAIARTLLLNPRILILDDSTSSVDTQTEHQIQRALYELMKGRTTFVIAHRLRTIQNADQILVLEHGRIVERGTHEDLVRNDGFYRRIYDLQLRDQEEMQAMAGRGEARRLESRAGAWP
ncbi:MAG: ABC transporter ATP-binding protein [Chloroflexota bacterium]|nr:ABC transporter ATP-binding protein/permease [Dehalococcoidia bacterium]MDW8252445.1 ABC transporter ATP-binding protein [Chloroflexota bacterium]